MEVLEWTMVGGQEPRTWRLHESERPWLRAGNAE